jgi:opine dehydrogenase
MRVGHVLILGAGNGGLAAIADLGSRGVPVALYNRGEAALAPIRGQGGVRYQGVLGEGFVPLETASTDLAVLVPDADVIMACVPASAHTFLAGQLAPVLRDGQWIVLNPGGMLGALAFEQDLRRAGFAGRVHIAETGTLSYICRMPEPGLVWITSAARDLPFAALPARETETFLERLGGAVRNLMPVAHVLSTGLTNINAVLHPPAMLLAAAWIEKTAGDFYYYYDTAVPSVGRLMDALDRERLAIASAWGVDAEPFLRLFARIGSTSRAAAEAGDYRQALLDSTPNR